jgi:hypothetical protein
MPDLCALLVSFLAALPEPILEQCIWDGLWTWCVCPSLRRDEKRASDPGPSRRTSAYDAHWQRARGGSVSSYTSSSTTQDGDDDYAAETAQIVTARALLRLLPRANFALFAYLLGFFSQIPLCSDNGMHAADIADMFGEMVFGTHGPQAKRSLAWFILRWSRIFDGLFDTPFPSTEDLFTSAAAAIASPSSDACPEVAVATGEVPSGFFTPVKEQLNASASMTSAPLSPADKQVAGREEFDQHTVTHESHSPITLGSPSLPARLPTPRLSFSSALSEVSSEEHMSFVTAQGEMGIDRIVFRGIDVDDDDCSGYLLHEPEPCATYPSTPAVDDHSVYGKISTFVLFTISL